MYKDLSLKEKAKVIREGVRLDLSSIDDILNLYDEAISYLQEKPIVSPYGQWKYPGRDTIIPSNDITMDNVNYPVLGISDAGDAKIMMPWNDYKFRGSMVYEHPLQEGGNTKPTFDLWYPTVPKQKNDTSSYDLRRAYNTLPFDELEKFRTINDYHLPSVAYDEKTDTYTFLKRNGHPTLNYELNWYNSGSPDALGFRERYKLDTLSLPWRYIPRIYLEGGNVLNYLNVPEYNVALYNTVSPLGDFPNFWGALAYRRLVKDKLKNGNIYERDYKVGDTQGEKTAMAAWAKRLGIPYDEQDLPVYNGDTVTLPYSLVLEIPYDTNMLKTRIQLNKALLDKYSKYRYSDVVDAAIKADLYNLDKLRETYKTGKPVGLTEFGWNSRQLVNNGEIVPIENIQSPLNVLGNYNVRYSPEERRLYYSDEYDFNQFENFVPGEPYRIRGYIDLDNNKALGGNLFKKGGHLYQSKGFMDFKSPEEILAEKYSSEPMVADNTNIVLTPVFTPQEKAYAKVKSEFHERHKSPEAEKKASREARLAVKDLKVAEFGTLDTPLSNDVQYAWRRFNNAKGTELLYPLPYVGEAMFGVDIADKLYSGNYGNAIGDLALYGAMTYAPEIANWARNNIGMYRATRLTKEGEALANQYFDFNRVSKERNALSGNNFFHGTSAKKGNDIWRAGSIDPNVTQGMYVSFGEVWPEHIYQPNVYIFPEETFGLRNATNYRGRIRPDIVNNVGRNKVSIGSSMKVKPGDWHTERYIDADGKEFSIFDMSTLYDIYNSNQTVIPENAFRNAISNTKYRIHSVSPGYKQSKLIEYNPSLGLRFKLSFTEDDYSKFIDNFIEGKTTMFSKGGSIHIKPENRGKFTALKKRTGHSASWFKAHGTPALRKMATFALNARHWNHKHQLGGYSTVFDKYNKYNEEKQLYFDTLPIVNEQAGIGRVDLPEVTVTAPDPNIWWTPGSNTTLLPSNIHGEPGLLKDIYTFMGEMAPSSLVAFSPLALNALKGLVGKEIVKQLIASEIGGRTVDLTSNATTGKTFGLNVGNVIEGITGWNPRNTILGTLITDGMNPGYGLSRKALASKNINLAMPITRAIDSKVRDSGIMEGLSTLWNNGKIVQKNIPYDPQKYYRIVGKNAIKDAENTGLIRGGLEFPDGPYFSKGKNVWNVNNSDYVIEGGPNISWIDAKKYNALYQHSNFGENVINGINALEPKGWQGGILLLTGNEKALTEAMPYYMQSTKVPSDIFTYWRNHPVIGWRLHSFKKKPDIPTWKEKINRLISQGPYKNSLNTTGKGSHYLTHTIDNKLLEKIINESEGMVPAPSIAITKDPNFDWSLGYTFYFDPKYIDGMKHVASPVDMYSPTWKNAETWANRTLNAEEVLKVKEEMLNTLGRLRETLREANYVTHEWRRPRSLFEKLTNRDKSLKSATRRLDMSYLFGNKHNAYGEVMPLEMVDLKKAVAVRPDAFNSTKSKIIEDFFTKYSIPVTEDVSKIPNLTY